MSLLRFLTNRLIRSTVPSPRGRLRVEALEAREVPTVDLLGIANSDFPTNKPLFVPITATADQGIDFSVQSDNANVSAEVVTGGRTVRFTVSGKDASNADFSGSFTLRLFENIAPLATQNIIELVKTGYYVNKEFHRVVNDFVIQGGSPNGDGQGGASSVTDARDEYNAQFTFASRGIVAMANAGDDNNNAQFFITDPFIIDSATSKEVDAPLDRRSQFLNFNHSVVGILTSGFDIYQRVMDVPKVLGSDGAISQPTTDVKITETTIIDDRFNAVVKLTALAGFLGTAHITVTGSHGGATPDSESKSFAVTSVADTVNDRPFLGAIGNLTISKDTPADFTLPFTELDSGDASTFAVGRVVNTANGPVFTTLDPTQATATVDANGKVTVTPASGFTGSFTLTVGVRDAQDRIGSSLGLNDARNFDTEKITVAVNTSANTAPTISEIANQNTPQGTPTGAVSFTIGDFETDEGALTLTVTTSNGALVPTSNVVFGGSGPSRTVTVTPVAGQSGTASLTVTVRDAGSLTASETFDVVVPATPNNTPPTVSNFTDKTIAQNGNTGAISFTVGDAETALDALTITVTSSNNTLAPANSVAFGGSGANRTLTITPATGQFGTATITVTVKDGGALTATDTFVLTVTALPSTIAITSTATTATTGRPVTFAATIGNPQGGTIQFFDGANNLGNPVPVVDGKAFISSGFTTAATHAVTAKYTPSTNAVVASNTINVVVTAGTAPVGITAEGSAAGSKATVTIRNIDGTVRHTLNPYGTFSGVVRVKVADVNGDGQQDAVAVPGFGGGPHIVVYDGNTGALIFQRMIFEDRFRGGLSLDAGDAMGLGYGQILVGAGNTGGPRVTLLDAKTNTVLLNYFAYDNASRGGVSVALSDLRGGNFANIITGAGVGLAPNVNVYNPFQVVGFETPDLYGTFVAGTKTDTSGIRIGTGPLIENARRDVLVGDVDTGDLNPLNQSFNPIALGVFVD